MCAMFVEGNGVYKKHLNMIKVHNKLFWSRTVKSKPCV